MGSEAAPLDERRARHALARLIGGSPPDAFFGPATRSEHWQRLVGQAVVERVVPDVALAHRSGIVALDAAEAQEVDELWAARMSQCLRIEQVAVWLVDELTHRGIDVRVLKGLATAHLDHPDPSARQFGDLDILVRPRDMKAVVDMLLGEGFVRRYQEFRPGFDERFVKSVSMAGPIEVDIHRTLAHGPVGYRIPVDELWSTNESLMVGGVELKALHRPGRYVHACLHWYLTVPPVRLSTLSDIAIMVRRGGVSVDDVEETASRWGVLHEVRAATASAVRELSWPDDISTDWQREAEPHPLAAALLASHRDPTTPSSARSLLSVMTIPRLPAKLTFLFWLLVPWGRTLGDVGLDRTSRVRLRLVNRWRSPRKLLRR